jgi:hypothetical protein
MAQPRCSPPLDIATGRVIGKCSARHRAAEFRKLLDEIEANVPHDLDYLIADRLVAGRLVRRWNSSPGLSVNSLLYGLLFIGV